MGDTHLPLFVSVEQGDLEPCAKGPESCRLWGSACIRIAESGRSKYHAVTILTMAGCEVCGAPHVTQGDLGVIDSTSGDIDDIYSDVIDGKARKALAEKVQTFTETET